MAIIIPSVMASGRVTPPLHFDWRGKPVLAYES